MPPRPGWTAPLESGFTSVNLSGGTLTPKASFTGPALGRFPSRVIDLKIKGMADSAAKIGALRARDKETSTRLLA